MKKSFDHLLRETLHGSAPEPPDGCLDAGVLAAWFEGTLDPGERAVAEGRPSGAGRRLRPIARPAHGRLP